MNVIRLTGAVGTFFRVPDNNALDFTQNFTIDVCVAPTAWSGVQQSFFSKGINNTVLAYAGGIASTGEPYEIVSTNGSTFTIRNSAVTLSTLPGRTVRWLRFSFQASTSLAKWYTSSQPPEINPADITWTLLNAQSGGAVGTLNNSTSYFEFGSRYAGTGFPFTGDFYRVLGYDSNEGGGAKQLDINPSVANPGATSFTESGPLGLTVSLLGAASIIAVPSTSGGVDSALRMPCFNFFPRKKRR